MNINQHIAKATKITTLREIVKTSSHIDQYVSIVWVRYYDYDYYYAFGVTHNLQGYGEQLDNDRTVKEWGILIGDVLNNSLF